MEEESMKMNICELCSSISETYKDNAKKVVLINTSDVYDGKCTNHTVVDNKNLKGQFKKTFKPNDILYSEIRPANRRFAYIDFDTKDYIASTKLMVIRANKGVNPKYLYQILRSDITINKLQMLAESRSGTFPQITFSELSNIEIDVPSEDKQDLIVTILSSLDAKIETNNKLNEKLEEMAQAIFKSWFVDFEPFKDKPFHETELGMIPEGWEVGYLSDISTITMGQSPCGTSYNENGEGIIFYQGRTEFGFRFPSVRLYTTAPSRFAEVGSTLMSVRAPVGDINMALVKCCIGRGVASIKSNCDCDSYIYYLMKSLKKRFDIYNGEGTVFGSVGRDTLRNMSITIPPSSVISDFEMNISKIDSRIKTNELESQRLASLRDTLLPRLMSGELIV